MFTVLGNKIQPKPPGPEVASLEIAAQLWGRGSDELADILAGIAHEVRDICETGDSMNTPIPVGLADLPAELFDLIMQRRFPDRNEALNCGLGEKLSPFMIYLINFGDLLAQERVRLEERFEGAVEKQRAIREQPTYEGILELVAGPRPSAQSGIIDLRAHSARLEIARELDISPALSAADLSLMTQLAGPSLELRDLDFAQMTLNMTVSRNQRAQAALAALCVKLEGGPDTNASKALPDQI